MAQRTLGLDVGHSAIKGVVLESSLRNFEIASFAIEPLRATRSDGQELYQKALNSAIHNLLEQLGPVDQIISCLPGEIGSSVVLDLPFSDTSKIDQVLGFQLDDITPLDVDDLLYDYQFVVREKDNARLLVGNAREESVAHFLETLSEAGAEPRILMMDGLPYYHLFHQAIEAPEDDCWAVVDIGDLLTTITVFQRFDSKDNPVRISRVRTLSRGTRQLEAALVAQGIAPESAEMGEALERALMPMVSELRRTFGTLQRQNGIKLDQLLITGGGSFIAGLHEILSKRLQLPVNQLYAQGIETQENVDWEPYQHTLLKALGMALRGQHRSRYAQINLRKGEYAFKGDLQFLKDRLGSIFVGVAILLVLVFASTFAQFSALSAEQKHLEGEVQKRCRKILGRSVSSPLRCLLIMEDEIQKVKGKRGKALIPKVSSYDIFLAVYDRIGKLIKAPGPTKIKVQIGSIRISPTRFEIEGDTDSYPSVDKIHETLKAYPCFKNMQKGRVRRASNSKKIEFRLRADVSC